MARQLHVAEHHVGGGDQRGIHVAGLLGRGLTQSGVHVLPRARQQRRQVADRLEVIGDEVGDHVRQAAKLARLQRQQFAVHARDHLRSRGRSWSGRSARSDAGDQAAGRPHGEVAVVGQAEVEAAGHVVVAAVAEVAGDEGGREVRRDDDDVPLAGAAASPASRAAPRTPGAGSAERPTPSAPTRAADAASRS